MDPHIYIGTSGWHYNDWIGTFYPPEVTGYQELRFISEHFNTVENNSSFYRIAGESTYKTWSRMTPPGYKFSLKLNRIITHINRLQLNEATEERIEYILKTTEVLGEKRGALVIQLPASFGKDLGRLDAFLAFITAQNEAHGHGFDIAIEFRSTAWFSEDTYRILRSHDVALVAAQSSRYPDAREVTARFAYIRLHGPKELFASKYSEAELEEWAAYVRTIGKAVKRVYIYFNNDFHRYAIMNGADLMRML
jgi:uncharacterized protein YecE (DUF72 family)